MLLIITGASGYVGSELVQFAASSGRNVIAIDRRANVFGFEGIKNVKPVKLDLFDLEAAADFFRRLEEDFEIIHAAANADIHAVEKSFSLSLENRAVTRNVVRLCLESDRCKSFKFISSGSVNNGYPISEYAKGKLKDENLVLRSGLNASIFRLYNVIGERTHLWAGRNVMRFADHMITAAASGFSMSVTDCGRGWIHIKTAAHLILEKSDQMIELATDNELNINMIQSFNAHLERRGINPIIYVISKPRPHELTTNYCANLIELPPFQGALMKTDEIMEELAEYTKREFF